MKSDDLSGQITLKIQPKTCFILPFWTKFPKPKPLGWPQVKFFYNSSKFYLLPLWPKKKSSQTWKKNSGQLSTNFLQQWKHQKFIPGSSKGCWIDDKGCTLWKMLVRINAASPLMLQHHSALITPSSTCLMFVSPGRCDPCPHYWGKTPGI